MNNWKYIVYETTNLVNNYIYIGVHQTDDPDKFDGYIGNGIYITQPYTYKYAKTKFQQAVKEFGPKNFRRRVLAVFDTEKEAYLLEEELVNEKFLARPDVYNMILGGEGGYFISNRIKVYQYDIKGNYLDEYESYAFAALQLGCDYTLISYAVRKKAKAKEFLWSTDKVEKLDLTNYNLGENHAKKVYCYSVTGKYLGGWTTMAQASKGLNIDTGCIRRACILGNCIKAKYYVSFVQADSYDIARTTYIKNRPVFRYKSDGKFDKEYETQQEAELDNPTSNISKAIRLKQSDENNYFWTLEKLTNFYKPKTREKKPVGKFDLEGNLVTRYESATAAANENGTSVWKVLAGTNKTHKQHIYKYL